jgi:hypothetical protein
VALNAVSFELVAGVTSPTVTARLLGVEAPPGA